MKLLNYGLKVAKNDKEAMKREIEMSKETFYYSKVKSIKNSIQKRGLAVLFFFFWNWETKIKVLN